MEVQSEPCSLFTWFPTGAPLLAFFLSYVDVLSHFVQALHNPSMGSLNKTLDVQRTFVSSVDAESPGKSLVEYTRKRSPRQVARVIPYPEGDNLKILNTR
jgi:hypothetical protein